MGEAEINKHELVLESCAVEKIAILISQPQRTSELGRPDASGRLVPAYPEKETLCKRASIRFDSMRVFSLLK